MKVVLTIAGSDSSGGAGIQADLKTMCAHRVYGMSAITAMTAQNTTGVRSIMESTPEFLEAQLDACFSDIPADAVKIGMLSSEDLLRSVVKKLREYDAKNIVTDPVMIATSGSRLMKSQVSELMAKDLFPISRVITPNLFEAGVLAGRDIVTKDDMEITATELGERYGCAVLVKGGHSTGGADDCLYDGGEISWFGAERIDNDNTHGTGCTLSSAIACNLALGYELKESVKRAKEYLTTIIGAGLNLGQGHGPLDHMYERG